MDKAIALVVVHGGFARTYAPLHVDVRVVDLDNMQRGDHPVCLPKGKGFEKLVEEASIQPCVAFTEDERFCARACSRRVPDLAADLAREFGGWWEGEHPEYGRETWRFAVEAEDTCLGYWDWVAVSLADDEEWSNLNTADE